MQMTFVLVHTQRLNFKPLKTQSLKHVQVHGLDNGNVSQLNHKVTAESNCLLKVPIIVVEEHDLCILTDRTDKEAIFKGRLILI